MNRSVTRALIAALSCVALSSAFAGIALAQDPSASASAPKRSAPPPKTMSDEQKTLYALGALLSRNLNAFSLTDAEFATVRQGFSDGFHHKPETKDAESAIPQVQALQKDRAQKVSDAYLAKAEKAPGAKKTASGLIFVSVKEGSGPSPTRSDNVKVSYEGRLTDGTVFDSSKSAPGGTASFQLSRVIACWTEALQLMKVGGKARIVCPSSIAYGQRQMGPKITPGSTLEFDIELLDIEAPPAAPAGSSSGAATGAPSPPVSH
ncbi:MAG TPA: FKBP-type peptidyl-prolyl cis-trans isomerase [Steroidobacteraceae bacterium]|jgi:FKBP-type peptidyl-prolyl cis-trans isomerase FkpA|nr:FKBP-type peptidyl-prolyl cis-trans isomerase [Steroidobacteraceae bacterium]